MIRLQIRTQDGWPEAHPLEKDLILASATLDTRKGGRTTFLPSHASFVGLIPDAGGLLIVRADPSKGLPSEIQSKEGGSKSERVAYLGAGTARFAYPDLLVVAVQDFCWADELPVAELKETMAQILDRREEAQEKNTSELKTNMFDLTETLELETLNRLKTKINVADVARKL